MNAPAPVFAGRAHEHIVDPGAGLHRREDVRIGSIPRPGLGVLSRISPGIDEDELVQRRLGLVPAEEPHLVRVRLGIQIAEHDDGIVLVLAPSQQSRERLHLLASSTARLRSPSAQTSCRPQMSDLASCRTLAIAAARSPQRPKRHQRFHVATRIGRSTSRPEEAFPRRGKAAAPTARIVEAFLYYDRVDGRGMNGCLSVVPNHDAMPTE
jgi:hypothetical protein